MKRDEKAAGVREQNDNERLTQTEADRSGIRSRATAGLETVEM